MTSKLRIAIITVITILIIIPLAVIPFNYFVSKRPVVIKVPRSTATVEKKLYFDGGEAFNDAHEQLSFGPRIPDSQAHDQVVAWMEGILKENGWEVQSQQVERQGKPVHNIIGKIGSGSPWIILGAHYDSRLWADQDPDPQKRTTPVPGANDGASGVAVLTELARVIPNVLDLKNGGNGQIWLVFFDAEDNGEIPGWDWLFGSRAFVESLREKPDAAVILDMIGDTDQQIYIERNSSKALVDEIWTIAGQLGYENRFIPEPKFSMIDDHTPFLQKGIPAVDVIDFNYPYWHTTADTEDKLSTESLQAVGDTMLAWLKQKFIP